MRTIIAALLFTTLTAFGQGTTSRITGTVEDPAGAMVANAAIKLINQASGVTFVTTTTNSGTYG